MRNLNVLVWCLAFALSGCATVQHELPLPDVRQSTGYTCSAAALLAVLTYYGEEPREDRLVRELGATPEQGAPPEAIVRVARAHGLQAELREKMTIRDLAQAVARGAPVIVALQAWSDKPRRSFADDWEDGHYVVVTAVEKHQVIFEDPSLLGSRAVLGHAEFMERWHDRDAKRSYIQLGILFYGKKPCPPPPRRHMD